MPELISKTAQATWSCTHLRHPRACQASACLNYVWDIAKNMTNFRTFKTHYFHYAPVSAQPVGSAVLLSIALNSDDMHFCCALLCVLVDAASIGLKLWSHADATCNGTTRSNLCHHCFLPTHLACKSNHIINPDCPDETQIQVAEGVLSGRARSDA